MPSEFRPATPEETEGALALVEDRQRDRGMGQLKTGKGSPSVFLPYQGRVAADKSEVVFVRKSRRIGLTWGLAGTFTLEAARSKGLDVYYSGYNKEMAAEFIGDCAAFAKAYSQAASSISVGFEHAVFPNGEEKDILRYEIKLASGHVVQALSSRPAEARGRQGVGIADEAAFHPDLDRMLEAYLAWTIWGGRVFFVSSINGADNPFTLLCDEIAAGKRPYSLHSIDFDQALAEGLYRRICLRSGKKWTQSGEGEFRQKIIDIYGEFADQELFLVPRLSGEVYIPGALYRATAEPYIQVIRYTQPPEFVLDPERLIKTENWCKENLLHLLMTLPIDRIHAAGWDFGRIGDLSVCWIWQQIGVARWRTAFVLELRNLPFDVQALIRNYVFDRLPHFHRGCFDARGNGQQHAESALQKYGPSRIECVMLTADWYALHFPTYKRALEDHSAIVPVDADLMDDHRLVETVRGYPKVSDTKHTKGQDGKKRHGDGAVAAVLGWAATEIPIQEYACHRVPLRAPAGHERIDEDDDDDLRISLRHGKIRSVM